MALHSTPLLMPEGPPPLVGGVDVYFSESHNVLTGGVDEDSTSFRGISLLVSFSDYESDRRALWTLRHALAFGRTTHWSGADWPDRLYERVAAGQPQFATAVVFVGSGESLVSETVQSAITSIRMQLPSCLAAVLVVSDRCDRLQELTGATGFVRGVRVTTGDTARQVFLALSVFLAPEALNGIDILDLSPAMGTAVAPSVLAQALWFREGDDSLAYPTGADKHAVATARSVLAVPFIRGWGWSELRRFHGAVRQDATKCRSPIVFATNNALLPGVLPSNVGWVPILCANH